jgi:hypothetical protein
MKPTLYFFLVRDGPARKWRRSKYKMTREHALIVYGRRNCELIGDSEEVRQVNPGRGSTRELRADVGQLRTQGRR